MAPISGRKRLTSRIGPALIHKLGHFGMCVTSFADTYDFYTTRFNFTPSDVSERVKLLGVRALTISSWFLTSQATMLLRSCTSTEGWSW